MMGYLRFLPSKNLWKSSSVLISKNEEVKREELIKKLDMIGYEKQSLVTKTGEYANRGFILDIFPYGFENPVRIEFFDNVIDEIRSFNPDTQTSISKLDNVLIEPFTEFINELSKDVPNRQSFLPQVVKEVSKLEDYLDNPITVFIDYQKIKVSYDKLFYEIEEFKRTDNENVSKYMHELEKILPNKYLNISPVDNFLKDKAVEKYFTASIENFGGNYESINSYLKKCFKENKKIIFYETDNNIVEDFCKHVSYQTVITNEKEIFDGLINIIKSSLSNGFVLNNFVVLTKNELYSKTEFKGYHNKFRYGSKIKDINKLEVGDYVVHEDFGVGKYKGLVTLDYKNLKKDYLYIEYKNNDKLYVPVEKIELISKYSSKEGATPILNKLGGSDWIKQKSRIKERVKDIAKKLLLVAASRKLEKGYAFLPDDEDQQRFEDDFSYVETKDQLKASMEIKRDMENPYPMDRLLCGDVGYGKTEVAFRAIYKAIRSGKQVAFLCPTTILSNQHFENAKSRFFGFGINIALLNRFTSSKKQKQILKDLKDGKTDLIIGTHRLLSKDVIYKDLGLLVIDEEQRFGVTHKEKIKEYKSSIDVLTLSATPIPRTLQMSLTGIRGLSLIETPPVDRYPIQTYVLRENDAVIKDAIYKEMARNGQVFILYNSVEHITEKLENIKKLVPEARVNYIHGQMNKKEIEDAMDEFVLGNYDVMVCTTIIETGIDIQNANTLIVLDADHFGLSQLYQIRGRIGRGKNIAYAYLMYNPKKELNEIAVKRLNAIKEFTELGSGYALAVRDLSIRGAGDILGDEQSGFIDTVGYDMYLRILNEEVERLKGTYKEEQSKLVGDKPFLQVSTHISDKYAETEDIKIEIHKKINTIDSFDSFNSVKEELEDRFGKLDDDVLNYLEEELFQALASKKGVIKTNQDERKIEVYFSKEVSSKIDVANVMYKLYDISSNFDFNIVNGLMKITLNLRELSQNYIIYLLKMLEVVE
jgi:transcription-repair coupling factor (superfamily II helicase)